MAKITMYLGSMDHSPSEQLGSPTQWHTTVLIVSHGGEHWELAEDIAGRMGLQGGMLKKWSRNAKGTYRTRFEAEFTERVTVYPVHIRAMSIQGQTMVRIFPELLRQMRLSDHIHSMRRNEKPYVCLGPLWKIAPGGENQSTQPVNFELPESQAIPAIFIAHCVLRAHKSIMELLVEDSPELEWVDWQLMPNKFPRGIDGPMAQFVNAVLSIATRQNRAILGTMRIMTLVDSAHDHGSILADNVAGLLAQKLRSSDHVLREPPFRGRSSSMLWHVWREVATGGEPV